MNSNSITLKMSKSTVNSFIAFINEHKGTVESCSNRLFKSRICVSFEDDKDLKVFMNGIEEHFGDSVSLDE